MTNTELITKLQKFPQNGFKFKFYNDNLPIKIFEDVDGTEVVDIGIGGFEQE